MSNVQDVTSYFWNADSIIRSPSAQISEIKIACITYWTTYQSAKVSFAGGWFRGTWKMVRNSEMCMPTVHRRTYARRTTSPGHQYEHYDQFPTDSIIAHQRLDCKCSTSQWPTGYAWVNNDYKAGVVAEWIVRSTCVQKTRARIHTVNASTAVQILDHKLTYRDTSKGEVG